jgi:hypothetical protein
MTMKAKIVQMVEGRMIVSIVDAENIIPAMEVRGAEFIGLTTRPRLRAELQGQPRFSTFCGPMYDEIDGVPALRYEDSDSNARLSV